MPYLILGLAGVLGIYLIARGLRGKNPAQVRRAIVTIVAVVATLMFGFVAASGRLGPFGWLAIALPAFFFWRNIRQVMGNLGGPTPGRESDIETRFLRMALEHDSGVLRGTVLEGKYRGRNLDEMSLSELLDLLHECRVEDSRSANVLETYLDRVHGAEWRDAGSDDDAAGFGRQNGARPGGSMTSAQAYEILGLAPGATAEQIREAHRRLLMANHPDRGGSTYIAAQINLAKDTLLPGG